MRVKCRKTGCCLRTKGIKFSAVLLSRPLRYQKYFDRTLSYEGGFFMEKIVVKSKKTMAVKLICYIAVLTALSAVANIFTVFFGEVFAVSFAYIPAFFAGACLGPFAGFLTGILGDLIGCLIAPKGALNPIILASSGLLGLIPGIVFKIGKNKTSPYALAVVSFLLTLLICTSLNTVGLYVFYFMAKGKTLLAVFILRTPKQVIIWGVNLIICLLLYKPLAKIVKL